MSVLFWFEVWLRIWEAEGFDECERSLISSLKAHKMTKAVFVFNLIRSSGNSRKAQTVSACEKGNRRFLKEIVRIKFFISVCLNIANLKTFAISPDY